MRTHTQIGASGNIFVFFFYFCFSIWLFLFFFFSFFYTFCVIIPQAVDEELPILSSW